MCHIFNYSGEHWKDIEGLHVLNFSTNHTLYTIYIIVDYFLKHFIHFN